MSDNPCLQIPCTAHSCARAAGNTEVVRQDETDAFYQDIAAAGGAVCRDRDRFDAPCMLFSAAVGLGQDNAQSSAPVRADIFDRYAELHDTPGGFEISVAKIYSQEILASVCSEIDRNRTGLRRDDDAAVYCDGRIGEGDSVALRI